MPGHARHARQLHRPSPRCSESDLLVALGSRFDDRVTGKLDDFAPDAKIIHVDIDPAEIGKNRAADVPIVGDCKDVIGSWRAELAKRQDEATACPTGARGWPAAEWKEQYPYATTSSADGPLKPQYCIDRLHDGGRRRRDRRLGRRPAPDVGLAVLEVQAAPARGSTPGGLGTMGFAVPAAMGAKAGKPDKRVIAIDGDGCFQMTAQELATSTTENIPFVTAIINNGYLGMVRQWQELFYDERYSAGEPRLRHARLREAGRGLRRGRPAGRAPRGGRQRHREGAVHQRPQRGHRLPRGPAGDGASRWWPPERRTTTSSWGRRACKPANDPAEAPIA